MILGSDNKTSIDINREVLCKFRPEAAPALAAPALTAAPLQFQKLGLPMLTPGDKADKAATVLTCYA